MRGRLEARVRVYLEVGRCGFRRYATYRAATAAGAFTNTIFGFIKAYTVIALWQARPNIGGYDATDAVTFCFLSQALLAPVAIVGGNIDLSERIRSGDVAIDLCRPVDFQAWWLANDLGRAAFQIVFRGLPPLAVGALFFPLHLTSDPARWLAFAVSVLLAVAAAFAIWYLTAISCFWLLDERGLRLVMGTAAMFFSGALLPLVVFPGWLGVVAQALPWAAMIQVPVDILLERELYGLGGSLAFQACWAAVLLALGRLVTAAAWRKVVVQGG